MPKSKTVYKNPFLEAQLEKYGLNNPKTNLIRKGFAVRFAQSVLLTRVATVFFILFPKNQLLLCFYQIPSHKSNYLSTIFHLQNEVECYLVL